MRSRRMHCVQSFSLGVIATISLFTLDGSMVAQTQTPPVERQDVSARPSPTPKTAKKPPRPILANWDQYFLDNSPSFRRNEGPLLRPERIVKKYENTRVTWDGTLTGFAQSEEGSALLVIAMKPKTVVVKTSPLALPTIFGDDKVSLSIAYLLATVDGAADVAKWKALATGTAIRFRVTLDGLSILFPMENLKGEFRVPLQDGVQVKGLLVSDAQLLPALNRVTRGK